MLLRGLVSLGFAFGMVWAAPALAVTMDDVRKAIAEDRLFDAYQDLQDLAEDGDPAAQYELGGFHHYGRVGPVNFEKARIWYERAAKQGNTDAMFGLAAIYGHGDGVPQDKKVALRWLIIAGTQNLSPTDAEKVASSRDHLAAGLSPQEIDAVLAEARAFTPKPE